MSKVGFPHIGNYYVPATYLFSKILHSDVISAPRISQKTIDLGVKYSPSFVCTPFKYTLGTMLEVIEEGADCVVQLGGGCRYGYYHELQRTIISDLGYDVKFINLIIGGRTSAFRIYRELKKIDKKFHKFKSLYYLFITLKMVKYMDLVDDYIRQYVGFEVNDGEMEKYNEEMLKEFSSCKGYFDLKKIYKKYYSLIKGVKVDIPRRVTRVGIIGELYTIMEPFSNYFIEKSLASFNMSIKRYTNVSYLMMEKGKFIKRNIKKYSKYVKYRMGADATDNIIRTVDMCRDGFDGIIHIKSSFCTPEIGSMGIINKICSRYNVPVMFFSFDSNTSRVGLQTRLEAFNDMIEMRKK